jgi:hypothetical protein
VGCLQGDAGASALALEQRFNRIAGTQPGPCPPTSFEMITADAAGDSSLATVANDHAAIAAVERQDGKQTRVKRGIPEVGLECEQV